MSAVRLGGRANGDERQVAWTSSAGTRHDCEEVKVRWCRFLKSSGELRGFKSGTEGAARPLGKIKIKIR
uniref:Uncharacterized protein n=1 Tax=Oryza sativa subsp. japonica TaxID=39947 RepID=Q6YX85_ORYSJ|nr:hypothetical protein [Oryza sativa Japonica Group]